MRLAIIGAGVAGLCAAKVLDQVGHDVVPVRSNMLYGDVTVKLQRRLAEGSFSVTPLATRSPTVRLSHN